MASIILLAAPKERRYGRPNSTLLIHEPYISSAYGQLTVTELQKISDDLSRETNKIVNTYVERTGTDEATIRSLMKEDKYIDMNKALELGFISQIITPITAKKSDVSNKNNINKTNQMKEQKVAVSKTILDRLLNKVGYQKIEDAEKALSIVAMELSTQDGTVLTIERDEGDPQVGDVASPDSEWLMPDGQTIIVLEDIITEIIEPQTETVP